MIKLAKTIGTVVISIGLTLFLWYVVRWYLPPEKINYENLERSLATGAWQEADQETGKIVVLKASGRNLFQISLKGVSLSEFAEFPCTDLLRIDGLWLKYSNDQFGLSIQQSIWNSTNQPLTLENQEHFNKQVGWDSKTLSELTFSLNAPRGHLPSSRWLDEYSPKIDGMYMYRLNALLSRTRQCYSQR